VRSYAPVTAELTTTPDHSEAGQRPIGADSQEIESQASDGNRQRERTLHAEDHKVTSAPRARTREPDAGSPTWCLCQIRAEARYRNEVSAGQKRTVRGP
jgi:hypothetical protein